MESLRAGLPDWYIIYVVINLIQGLGSGVEKEWKEKRRSDRVSGEEVT
jgi:hypothetical protein